MLSDPQQNPLPTRPPPIDLKSCQRTTTTSAATTGNGRTHRSGRLRHRNTSTNMQSSSGNRYSEQTRRSPLGSWKISLSPAEDAENGADGEWEKERDVGPEKRKQTDQSYFRIWMKTFAFLGGVMTLVGVLYFISGGIASDLFHPSVLASKLSVLPKLGLPSSFSSYSDNKTHPTSSQNQATGSRQTFTFWKYLGPYTPYPGMEPDGPVFQNGKVEDHAEVVAAEIRRRLSKEDEAEHSLLTFGCEVDQVTVLHRHTSRYMTGPAKSYALEVLRKIARSQFPSRMRPSFSHTNRFIITQEYLRQFAAGDIGRLTDVGRYLAWRSGIDLKERYLSFLANRSEDVPFIRSSGSGRAIETAGYLTLGLNNTDFKLVASKDLPQTDWQCRPDNNPCTLKTTCPAHKKQQPAPGFNERDIYFRSMGDQVARTLNKRLELSTPLNSLDLQTLMSLCAFESQRDLPGQNRGPVRSRWCDLFDHLDKEEEAHIWKGHEYIYDVTKYYGHGPGDHLAPSMGIGYVNELIARLTDSRVTDPTNSSMIEKEHSQAPQGGRRLFIDLSHDNNILHFLAAMKYFKDTERLPVTYPPSSEALASFSQSDMTPFGSRVIFERLSCQDSGESNTTTMKIRMLINDEQKLVMSLKDFIDSLSWAKKGGDWKKCFGVSRGLKECC